MKHCLFIIVSALTISSGAIAASASTKKVCFGSKQNDDTRGVVMTAEISKAQVALKTVKEGQSSDFNYNGTFPTYNKTVNGRDGKVYLTYRGKNSDYQDVIMVDEALLKKAATGLLQIRARGEGFFNSTFVCKDDTRR